MSHAARLHSQHCSPVHLKLENETCAVSDLRNATDFSFVLVCAFLIFFMKAGFVMLDYGACNLGHVGRLLLLRMKVVDTVLGALTFWLVGYSIAFTPTKFAFNNAQFEDLETEEHHLEMAHSAALWEFHFAFAANAATIVTGAVVGRVQLIGYLLGTVAITGFVHPLAAQWVWNEDGWLSSVGRSAERPGIWGTNGFIDFAGAVIIHMLGAVAALVCAVFAGKSKRSAERSDHYVATLGMMILWFSWYGFCCGTADGVSSFRYIAVTHIAIAVTLAIASAGFTMFVMQAIRQLRKARNVPHWELGKQAMITTERRLPRSEMIPQIMQLRHTVRIAVRTSKQARIMFDRLTISGDRNNKEWADDLKKLRLELKKVWHTGNIDVISDRTDNLLRRMTGAALASTSADQKNSDPILEDCGKENHDSRKQYNPSFNEFELTKTEDLPTQAYQKQDLPYVEWTVADDDFMSLLCGLRNRYPLGHHFTHQGVHHRLHPSGYEMVVLAIIFVLSLPALLPILLLLLGMAYLGPVDQNNIEIEKVKLEDEQETTPDADPSLVNSELLDWYLLQREKKKLNLLADNEEIELESLGFQWYPRVEDLNLLEVLHAMLVGLVAITACGNVLPSYMAAIIGVCCVFFYELGVLIEQLFHLYDSMHAFPVHGMGGLCGAMFASFSFIHNRDGRFNLFYGHPYLGDPYRQWFVQYLGLITISLWVIGSMLVVYGTLWYFDWLAVEGAQLNKWRITMRQHHTTVWAGVKRLFYDAVFIGMCGERVIRHDQKEPDNHPPQHMSQSSGSHSHTQPAYGTRV